MKLIMMLLFLSIHLISMGAVASYYAKLDAEGFVIDLTLSHTDLEGYTLTDLNEAVKPKHLRGYYKLVGGYFVEDETKKAEWLAAQPDTEGM